MQSLQIIADMSLPGMSGARTRDIAAIQKNILTIQQAFQKKIYLPGDIGPTRALVITNVFNFVCIVNLHLLELTGYMSFVNAQKSEMAALDIFHVLCPSKPYGAGEMDRLFLTTYSRIKYFDGEPQGQLCFVRNPALRNAEVVY